MGRAKQVQTLTGFFILALFLSLGAWPLAQAQAQSSVIMEIQPGSVPQNSTVTISIVGFRPGELVNIWQTFPDTRSFSLGNVTVDSLGRSVLSLFLGSVNPTGIHTFGARGSQSRRETTASLEITLGEGNAPSETVQIGVSATDEGSGTTFKFIGAGYKANELVSTWVRLPNDQVIGSGQVYANDAGIFRQQVKLNANFPEGTYYLTGYGNMSGLTGIISFDFRRVATVRPARDVKLTILPDQVRQYGRFTLEGENFGMKEDVSSWLTLANSNTALPLFDKVKTSDDGFFAVDLSVLATPVGTHTITVYGKTSGKYATVTLVVLP